MITIDTSILAAAQIFAMPEKDCPADSLHMTGVYLDNEVGAVVATNRWSMVIFSAAFQPGALPRSYLIPPKPLKIAMAALKGQETLMVMDGLIGGAYPVPNMLDTFQYANYRMVQDAHPPSGRGVSAPFGIRAPLFAKLDEMAKTLGFKDEAEREFKFEGTGPTNGIRIECLRRADVIVYLMPLDLSKTTSTL